MSTTRVESAKKALAEALVEEKELEVLSEQLYALLGYTPGGMITKEVQRRAHQVRSITHDLLFSDN